MPDEQPALKLEIYQIVVRGCLNPRWADWFEGFAITSKNEAVTVLVGPIADQSALYGLLASIRDLGLTLLSVNRIGREICKNTPSPHL
jgi:hypothetical protein